MCETNNFPPQLEGLNGVRAEDGVWRRGAFSFLFFFIVRKISPELTFMPILLFLLRKTGPELTSVPIFLYVMWNTATARPDKRCVGACPGSEPGPPAAERAHLTAKPRGQPVNYL